MDGVSYPGMSLREYSAINLCVPDSGVDWLDKMIRKSLRDKFAGQALMGMCADPAVDGPHPATAFEAYAYADAMLKA
jgi:hypothetical protein